MHLIATYLEVLIDYAFNTSEKVPSPIFEISRYSCMSGAYFAFLLNTLISQLPNRPSVSSTLCNSISNFYDTTCRSLSSTSSLFSNHSCSNNRCIRRYSSKSRSRLHIRLRPLYLAGSIYPFLLTIDSKNKNYYEKSSTPISAISFCTSKNISAWSR